MAKQNDLVLWAIVGILAFAVFGNQGTTPPATGDGGSSGGSVDLCTVVEPDASFTAQNMYVAGTAITTEYVRILKNGGALKDLSYVSLDSGTQNTAANQLYNLYWGENSTTYYTEVERYTAPCQDATDDKVGKLCTIDTNPTVTVFDENSRVQSSTANAQAVVGDDVRDITIRVRVASDECFGNPDSDVSGTNAICFRYNSTVFQSVEAETGAIAVPYPVGSVYTLANNAISCYELPKLADHGQVDIPVTLKSGSTQPTTAHNISIYLDDVAFDLNADTLEEINGFSDEDNNALGSAVVTGDTIYVS